jgi:CopG antitoxin of type II toxin-antitoxin system
MSQLQRAPSKIPEFDSLEEEAEFWDTHSTTEFEDEWEPVEVAIAPEVRSHFIVEIEFDRPTWYRLRDHARARGLRLSELAREWVLEGFARAGGELDGAAPPAVPPTE